ncbi:MAG TPA: serine/threonine protein kinase [Caldithrix abyssi]|uniref:Serine/threonine protein kinase n=1 Tax=Caldithrix abyssi TaxID=187145 RepID=A0A7V1LM67_CALAY|nr:serine/threonine protein kinase [Caldithrix abyssi]
MIIDRYHIDEEIARNGPITVYRAHHDILKRTTLLKVYDGADKELIAQFEEEARIVAALESDHVARIYDFGFANEHLFFIAAEFVEGGNLSQYISRQQPDREQRIRLCARIVQAVAYIHSKGYIHRDLKPENILVTGDGRIKITDFGISLHEAIKKHTPEQKLTGTPLYMAPEQVNNLPVTRQTDIFTLGTIFYSLFAAHPFDAPSYGEIFAKIISHQPPPLAQAAEDIPEWFSALVEKMMQKKAERRPTDLQSVAMLFQQQTGETLSSSPPAGPAEEDERKGIHPLAGALILIIPLLLYIMFTMVRDRLQNAPDGSIRVPDSSRVLSPDTVSRTATPSAKKDGLPVTNRPKENSDRSPSETGRKGPARLWINAYPWARVYVDYNFIDITPLKDTLSLEPGWHKIQLQNPAYATWTDSLFIKSGEFKEVGYHLDSLCYSMRLQVQPWGKVYVDNIFIGETPLGKPLLLTKANKTLTIKNKFYKTYTETLNWDGSPIVDRRIVLEKKAEIQ